MEASASIFLVTFTANRDSHAFRIKGNNYCTVRFGGAVFYSPHDTNEEGRRNRRIHKKFCGYAKEERFTAIGHSALFDLGRLIF